MSTISAYTGDGSTTQFDITFTYRSASTVKASLDGVETTAFSFVNPSRIQFDEAPASGAEVKIFRRTSVSSAEVEFEDGAIIRGNDLNDAVAQPRDRVEEISSEVADLAGGALRAPSGETLDTLPALADRIDKYLAFGAGGSPVLVTAPGSDMPVRADLASTASGKGAALVAVKQLGAGAVDRSALDKLREQVSVMDFGATGDGETDDTAAIQAAIDYVESTVDMATHSSNSPANGAQCLFFPAGLYLVNGSLVITKSMSILGDGHSEYSSGTRIQQEAATTDLFRVEPIAQGASVSFDDLTLRANGGGGASGALINITKPALGGQCNSVRIRGCTFGSPQKFAIQYQRGDDILIEGNLFDVSALQAISLGTSTAADVVTNVRIVNNDFFDVSQQAILLYNVDGLIISDNTVWSTTSTTTLVDGTNTVPYQIKNVTIKGNTLERVHCVANVTAVNGFIVEGNTGDDLGGGAGSTNSLLQFAGACSGVVVANNRLSGNLGAKHFYDDTAATVAEAAISGNSFKATGGTGAAIRASNTGGGIGVNSVIGFAERSIGHRWTTSGNAMAPGVVTRATPGSVNLTVVGVQQGDNVVIQPASTAPMAPTGFVVDAYVSAPNTVTVRYQNAFAADPSGVPAHDISAIVMR